MPKFKVTLTKTTYLDERIVEAKSEDEADKKAFMTFEKMDRENYDDIIIEEIEDEE